MLLTRVDRPWLDRRPPCSASTITGGRRRNWTIATNLIGSDILQSGTHTRDSGATMVADYEMGDGWRQQWLGMHFGDQLQINDFGYLDRNNFNYGHWEVRKRYTDLPADSAYSSHDWRFRIDALDNDHGLRLRRQLRISDLSNLRNGATEPGAAQRQQRRLGRSADARSWRAVPAAELRPGLRTDQPAPRRLGVQAGCGGCQRRSRRQSPARLQTSSSCRPTSSATRSACMPGRTTSTFRTGWCGSTTT